MTEKQKRREARDFSRVRLHDKYTGKTEINWYDPEIRLR